VQTAPAPARRPLISGASLSELLASAGSDPDEELSDGETPDEAEVVTVDPECAEKLEHARSRILNLIKEKRPRFVPAFELMTFRDNTISVSVPTTELREEILRSKTGMLMRIAELASITGAIELEVVVNEEIRAARPIKLEDRVKYTVHYGEKPAGGGASQGTGSGGGITHPTYGARRRTGSGERPQTKAHADRRHDRPDAIQY